MFDHYDKRPEVRSVVLDSSIQKCLKSIHIADKNDWMGRNAPKSWFCYTQPFWAQEESPTLSFTTPTIIQYAQYLFKFVSSCCVSL